MLSNARLRHYPWGYFLDVKKSGSNFPSYVSSPASVTFHYHADSIPCEMLMKSHSTFLIDSFDRLGNSDQRLLP